MVVIRILSSFSLCIQQKHDFGINTQIGKEGIVSPRFSMGSCNLRIHYIPLRIFGASLKKIKKIRVISLVMSSFKNTHNRVMVLVGQLR